MEARNFRNLESINFRPGPGLNVFQGNNAQGKTNILESIYLLATGSSFRTNQDKNLVNHDKDYFVLRGKYSYDNRNIESVLEYRSHQGKTLKINSHKTTFRHPDRLRVVLFTPDDLYLIKGAPAKRRQFLDFILKQTRIEYEYNLDNYVKLLKKRNNLLKKEQSKTKSFKIIDELFIENAAHIILNRMKLINILEENAILNYKKINKQGANLKIRYALSFPIDSDKINLDILKEAIKKQIKDKHEQEIQRKSSLVGPHRDDINIYLDDRLARYYASQGQQRNIVIALKLAEIDSLRRISGINPLFLLDEVLSELDPEKKYLLLDLLENANFQSFLTSVDMSALPCLTAAAYVVKDGKLL